MKTLTSPKDVEGVKFGDQFVIEPASWPGPDDESQEITAEMLADRDAIVDAINAALAPVEEKPADTRPADADTDLTEKYTVKELKAKLTEHQVVGRSKLRGEAEMIDALLAAGVQL